MGWGDGGWEGQRGSCWWDIALLPEHVEQCVQHADAACDGQQDGVALHEDALHHSVRPPSDANAPTACLHLVALPLVHRAPRLVQPKAMGEMRMKCGSVPQQQRLRQRLQTTFGP